MESNSHNSGKKGANSRHWKPVDALTNVLVTDDSERLEQWFEFFVRSLWDPKIRNEKSDNFFKGYYMPYARARKADGFRQKDYAFRNAAWHVNNVIRDIEKSGQYRKEKPDEIRKEGYWDYYTSFGRNILSFCNDIQFISFIL